MGLLQLPEELLVEIFRHVLYDIRIRRAILLLPTCRVFERLFSQSIYALPVFDGFQDGGPRWEEKMSKRMVVGLIMAKLENNPSLRPLTSEIQETVQIVDNILPLGESAGYVDALAHLAVENLTLKGIIPRLSIEPRHHHVDLLHNAVAAALYSGNLSHVHTFLNHDIPTHQRPGSFGDLLTIAACHTDLEGINMILRWEMSTEDAFAKDLLASRLYLVLEAAAANGRSAIFCRDIWAQLKTLESFDSDQILFGTSIRAALLAGHTDVVRAILALLRLETTVPTSPRDDELLRETLRLACSENSEEVLAAIIELNPDNALRHIQDLFGDASRAGHVNILRALKAAHPTPDADFMDQALFWATRNLQWEMLSILFEWDRHGRPIDAIAIALAGAAFHGTPSMNRVIESASIVYGIDLRHLDGVEGFKNIIDQLLSDDDHSRESKRRLLSSTPLPSASPRKPDLIPRHSMHTFVTKGQKIMERLDNACWHGDIVAAQTETREICAGYDYFGCYKYAMESGKCSILLYLFERVPPDINFRPGYVTKAITTSTSQILLDYDESAVIASNILGRHLRLYGTHGRWESAQLLAGIRSEQLTRWNMNRVQFLGEGFWRSRYLHPRMIGISLNTIRLLSEQFDDLQSAYPLHLVMCRNAPDQLAIIDWLLAHDVPINAAFTVWAPLINGVPLERLTPALHWAVQLGQERAIELLQRRGADPITR